MFVGEFDGQVDACSLKMFDTLRTLWLFPRRSMIALIRLYQATLSPDHGPLRVLHPYGFCRHEPTCSEYGVRILEQRGFVIGMVLLIRRVLSCHPWKKPSPERIRKVIDL